MKLPIEDRILSSFGVLALTVILLALAVLQYRWSRELSDAASDRMRAGLYASMVGLREDLNREFAGLSLAFQFEPGASAVSSQSESYMERLDAWKRTTSHPGLVANVFVWENATAKGSRLLRLNTTSRQFEAVDWPENLGRLHEDIGRFGEQLSEFARHVPETLPRNGNNRPQFAPRGGPWAHGGPWLVDQSIPAVLHAQVIRRGDDKHPQQPSVNWIIVQLDESVIQQSILPELVQKYFAGPEGLIYDVAVVSKGEQRRVIYSSNSQLGMVPNAPVDAKMNIFGPPGDFTGAVGATRPTAVSSGQSPPVVQHEWHFVGRGGLLRLEPFRRGAPGPELELIAKHRKGSLEAALVSMRRRHMAVSFGVLLLLAVSMAMIIVSTRRAQRLAKLQMDFVAGVSHELRTPLAVIGSAADNIADGIIEDKRKLARYGEVIRNQSRQLSQLVEQILLFAATRQDRYHYNLTPVQPSDIVQRALANSAELLRTAGITVEQDVEAGLPPVMADLSAVSHSVQNLITNAVKYGGDKHWIAVKARREKEGSSKGEVQISVEDKGIGIEKTELERIFDPFYRSPAVVGAQIHGTGLGLALARGVAEAMGGRISVKSKPGEGSVFVLHLPCAPQTANTADDVVVAVADSSSPRS